MKCNKDEDVTTREVVEQKLTEKDIKKNWGFGRVATNWKCDQCREDFELLSAPLKDADNEVLLGILINGLRK